MSSERVEGASGRSAADREPNPGPGAGSGGGPGEPAPGPANPGGEAQERTWVYAVVGGIASGKSTVAAALAGPGGVVLAADDLAHEALREPEVIARVRERFGDGVIGADAAPDRTALARVVFDDPGARKALEGWIHARVRERLRAGLENAVRDGAPRVVLDVPLLLENAEEHGLLDRIDLVVFVDAPLEQRERRATRNRGWEPGEVARREAAQMPLATKRQRADVVIDNPDPGERTADGSTDDALAARVQIVRVTLGDA
ncbi:MAG: dephospho-CoA kinase [Planctomycetota bacterium]